MDEFLKVIVAAGLVASDAAVVANKEKILAAAAAAGVTLEACSTQLVDAAIENANFGFLGNAVKGTLISGLNQAIANLATEAEAREPALLGLIVAAARNYANTLGAPLK